VVATIAGRYGVISRSRFAEIKEKPTDHLNAHEAVLRADAYYRDNFVATEHAKVRDYLERAVKSDPSYAEAWANLSFIYLDEHRLNFNPRPDPLDRAFDAARRAVASDPTSQWARHALAFAYFYRRDFDAFFAECERAIALNPNNATVLAAAGRILHIAGDEGGVALVRKAMKLDPFHPTWFYFTPAHYHFQRGEYEEALVSARKIDTPGVFWTPAYLAAIYAELGREQEARSALEDLLKLYPGFTTGKLTEECRKQSHPDASIRHWVSALRKAGLPEGTGGVM
jgi:tetratricopeptide (TPR) repeat protein